MNSNEKMLDSRVRHVLEYILKGVALPITEAQAKRYRRMGKKTMQRMIELGHVTPDPDRKEPLVAPERQWLIWSLRNGAWLKSPGCGYTNDISKAHRYGERQARQLVAAANVNRRWNESPEEAMVPV